MLDYFINRILLYTVYNVLCRVYISFFYIVVLESTLFLCVIFRNSIVLAPSCWRNLYGAGVLLYGKFGISDSNFCNIHFCTVYIDAFLHVAVHCSAFIVTKEDYTTRNFLIKATLRVVKYYIKLAVILQSCSYQQYCKEG